ncbi:uncharacterized protein LOC125945321 isoform X1 [Dermacentor silvarum]|uniref:uncharacterized protein LOC125945321 isoform X1 n=1 Tax=Dermacentor silvarum TaxID=543639 RepID=UPI0021018E3D|nr:uncharacterized protein LOC125945321 isoform X1 [Dermacentor silvarum]
MPTPWLQCTRIRHSWLAPVVAILSITSQANSSKTKAKAAPLFYSLQTKAHLRISCDNPNSGYSQNLNYDGVLLSMITYDLQDGFAITFENRFSLREKICDAWTVEATNKGVGLAVYDVNYDSRSTMCNPVWLNGTWYRFHFVLRIRDFLLQVHPEASLYNDCLNVV